ncbi:MAG: hypothetical protein J0L73_12600 [Verrucomicrobia bacterium]|nr:hypothetical protein [Verrucomicrobiota bacterium]
MNINRTWAFLSAVLLAGSSDIIAADDGLFACLAAEDAIESVSASQKTGGFTQLPFTINGQQAGKRINEDVTAFRDALRERQLDGLPQKVVELLDSNRAGYLYACLSASTTGREIEIIERIGKAGFTDSGPRNAITLYGVYILYNGARDKQVLQKPVLNLTESFARAKKPLVPIGKIKSIADTLNWAVSQPIPPSPFDDQAANLDGETPPKPAKH